MVSQYLATVAVALALIGAGGCTHKPARKPKSRSVQRGVQMTEPVQPQASANDGDAGAAVVRDTSGCVPAPAGQRTPPFYLPGHGIMVTRVLKTCVTDDGQPGYAADTAWMAMGFPCTGGHGRLEWKPNYHAPKIVSFSVSTDCPTAPALSDEVIKIGRAILGLNELARLMAYTPMAVQYWEIDEYKEVNTGSVVEFREAMSLDKGWANFKNNLPLRVRLYGRENVWGEGDQIYMFEADLIQESRTTFKLSLVNAQALSDDDADRLQQKCQALRPRRNCRELFAN